MLEIDINVLKGILYVDFKGVLNRETINDLEREINYLVYKQGMHYFVFDFKKIDRIEANVFDRLENKLMDIFLSCGKVIVYGLDNDYKINKHDKLFYAKEGLFKYVTM